MLETFSTRASVEHLGNTTPVLVEDVSGTTEDDLFIVTPWPLRGVSLSQLALFGSCIWVAVTVGATGRCIGAWRGLIHFIHQAELSEGLFCPMNMAVVHIAPPAKQDAVRVQVLRFFILDWLCTCRLNRIE